PLEGSPHARDPSEAQASALTAVAKDEDPEAVMASRELGRHIEAAIAAHRPEYRTAILLWHVEWHAYEEIAEIMGIPLGTVKTYIHRARNELRQRLAHLRV